MFSPVIAAAMPPSQLTNGILNWRNLYWKPQDGPAFTTCLTQDCIRTLLVALSMDYLKLPERTPATYVWISTFLSSCCLVFPCKALLYLSQGCCVCNSGWKQNSGSSPTKGKWKIVSSCLSWVMLLCTLFLTWCRWAAPQHQSVLTITWPWRERELAGYSHP